MTGRALLTRRVRRGGGSRGSRGSASLELVALLPLLFAVALLALQGGAVVWVMSSTSEAARAAARAASLGQDPRVAAEQSLPGGLTLVGFQTVGPGHGVRLDVRVPRVSPLPEYTVTRWAVMP